MRLSYTVPTVQCANSGKTLRKRLWAWTIRGVFLLTAWALIAWSGASWLIINSELRTADTILILSGSGAYQERVQRATELYKDGLAPIVVLTNDGQQGGWSVADQRNLFSYEMASRELLSQGVPKDAIIVIPIPVSSTHEEAIRFREYAEQHKLKSALIVTSAYHSRRALWTFRHVCEGSEIWFGIETAPPGKQTPTPVSWWLYPKGWSSVAGEYVKWVYYRLTLP